MKLKFTIILIIYTFHLKIASQIIKYPSIILNNEFGFTIARPAEKNNGFPDVTIGRFAPSLSIKAYEKLYFGINYDITKGKINGISIPTLNAFGLHTKYFIGSIFNDPLFQNRILFNVDLSVLKSNYSFDNSMQFGIYKLQSFKNTLAAASFNLNFRAYKSLYINAGYVLQYYSINKKCIHNGPSAGFSYNINEKRKLIPRDLEPIKIEETSNQKKKSIFLKQHKINLAYSYLFDDDDSGYLFYYSLSTFKLKYTISLSNNFDIGAVVYQMNEKNPKNYPSNQYTLFGGIANVNIFNNKDFNRGYFELGFLRGNLCICDDNLPVKRSDLNYIPLGIGYEQKFKSNKLSLSFFATKYISLNTGKKSQSYLFPFIGLNYDL